MATFELPPVDVRHMQPARGIRDNSDANAINSLAEKIGAIGNTIADSREAAAKAENSAFLGEATTGVLDLQNERIASIDNARALTQRTRFLTEDEDGFTEEDAKSLQATEKQLQKLKTGRLTGMSASEFAARKNTLHSQFLANAPHLTQEINALFNSGLAQPAKIKTAGEEERHKTLDQMYGVGGWTPVTEAHEISKALYLQEMQVRGQASITALDGQVAHIATAIGDGPMQALLTSISETGALNESATTAYNQAIFTAFNTATDQLNSTIAQARARGEKLDQTEITRLRNEIADARTFYTQTVFDTTLKGKDLQSQIKKSIEIRRLMFEARLPVAAAEMQKGSMGGVGGAGMQNYLLQIVQMPAGKLQALFPNAPAAEVQRMRDLARTVVFSYANSEEISFNNMAKQGLITPAMATLLSGQAMVNSPSDAENFARGVESYRASLMLPRDDLIGEAITNFGSLATTAASAAAANNGVGAGRVRTEVNQLLRSYIKRVADGLEDKGLVVTVNDEGALEVIVDPATVLRQGGIAAGAAGAAGAARDQIALNALVGAYEAYADHGLADLEDLQSLVVDPSHANLEEGSTYEDSTGRRFVVKEGKPVPIDAAAPSPSPPPLSRTEPFPIPDFNGGTASMLAQVKRAVEAGAIKPSDHADVLKAARNNPEVAAYLRTQT